MHCGDCHRNVVVTVTEMSEMSPKWSVTEMVVTEMVAEIEIAEMPRWVSRSESLKNTSRRLLPRWVR